MIRLRSQARRRLWPGTKVRSGPAKLWLPDRARDRPVILESAAFQRGFVFRFQEDLVCLFVIGARFNRLEEGFVGDTDLHVLRKKVAYITPVQEDVRSMKVVMLLLDKPEVFVTKGWRRASSPLCSCAGPPKGFTRIGQQGSRVSTKYADPASFVPCFICGRSDRIFDGR